MLKIGVIGIGNAGGQVADLATTKGFEAVALNTSVTDTESLKVVQSIIIGDEKGSGKDRATAKSFARANLDSILKNEIVTDMLNDVEVLAIASSTGGGTGSGMAPVMSEIISRIYPDLKIITYGIMPGLKESVASQQNTIDYLKELRKNDSRVYSLYDNDRVKGNLKEVLTSVNEDIVHSLCVIRGEYQTLTPYNSIDDKDMLRIISTPGRLATFSISDFAEKDIDDKSIEERLLEVVKSSSEVELELDKIVNRLGLIVNLSEKLFKTMDIDLSLVKEYVGEPVEGFEHVALDGDDKNSVHVLLSGLSIPDDRIEKVVQRINSAMEALSVTKSSSILDEAEDNVSSLRKNAKKEVDEKVNVGDIFGEYF